MRRARDGTAASVPIATVWPRPTGSGEGNVHQGSVDGLIGGSDVLHPGKRGGNGEDGTHNGTTPYVCCWRGTCNRAGGFGPSTFGSRGTCCSGCTRCPEPEMCCNLGPGTEPRRVANVAYCPTP